jgi:hypothetical protein
MQKSSAPQAPIARVSWGFRLATTGLIASGVAFFGGVSWNLTDDFPQQSDVEDCLDQGFDEAYSTALLETMDSGVFGESDDTREIEFTHEDGSKTNVPVSELRRCQKLHEQRSGFYADHPSRRLVVGGLAGGLACGMVASSSTQRPRERASRNLVR